MDRDTTSTTSTTSAGDPATHAHGGMRVTKRSGAREAVDLRELVAAVQRISHRGTHR